MNTITKICEGCNTMKNMHPSWTHCKKCMCGVLIHASEGLCCANPKPCKMHGKQEGIKISFSNNSHIAPEDMEPWSLGSTTPKGYEVKGASTVEKKKGCNICKNDTDCKKDNCPCRCHKSSPTQNVEEKYIQDDFGRVQRVAKEIPVSPTQDWITKYDMRGMWASEEDKELFRKQINKKIDNFIIKAKEEEREKLCAEILAKIHTTGSEHFCTNNDGKQDCECYLEAKRDIAFLIKKFYLSSNKE